MSLDFHIAKLANELEEAGELGIAAAAALAPFLLAGSSAGAFSGTDTGFIWTKTLGDIGTPKEVPLGFATLEVSGATLSATVGVHMKEGSISDVNVLFSVLGTEGDPQFKLVINPKVAVLADKVESSGQVVGYENAGAPLEIDMPMVSLEFGFHMGGDGLQASFVLHESASELVSGAWKIIEVDLDKVIVFPKLGKLGLYVDRLVLDFTETAAAGFTDLFPEVYEPSWKGIGAKQVKFLYPVGDNEFIYGGSNGFLIGFDKKVSASVNVGYTSSNPDNWIKQAEIEVELRNNQFLKSSLSADLNLKKLLEEGEAKADSTSDAGLDPDQQTFSQTARDERADKTITLPADSALRLKGSFVLHTLDDGTEVWGADLIATGVSVGGSDHGLVFTGSSATSLYYMGLYALGILLLARGVEQGDHALTALAVSLMLLSMIDFAVDLLPDLEQLVLSELGIRLIHVDPADETEDSETILELILGIRLKFKMNGRLLDLVEFLLDKLQLEESLNAGAIFGTEVENIKLGGYAELALNNIYIPTSEPDEKVARLFGRKGFNVKAVQLPQLKFEDEGETKGTALVPQVSFVSNQRDDQRTWYGISFQLTALTGPSVTIDTPAAGVILYFYPSLDLAFVAQLAKEPGFTVLVPKLLLAKGVIELDKPIPAFEGTQSRVAIDVGILPKNPSAPNKDLLKLGNYRWQVEGNFAWGTATATDGPGTEYDFCFAQVGFSGESPLISVGPVGLYGLNLLYGKNIQPGYPGGQPTAVGIADWILSSPNEEALFDSVKDWPPLPTSSTWHPHYIWDDQAGEYRQQRVGGAIIVAGSAGDKGNTFKGELLGLMGLDEFWLAIAGRFRSKAINLEAITVVAHDRGTFLARLILEYLVNDDGKFAQFKAPIEIGSSEPEDRDWTYVGHYEDEHGGPVTVDLMKRFKAKFFLVRDSQGFEDFGFMPIEGFARPDIPAPAWGVGAMFQFGPKKYGPSFLNLKLFAALGFNIGFCTDPEFLVGEVYAGGYMQLKVIVFKFKLELLARLQGMAIDEAHRFLGQLEVRLNLPWPFDDVSEEFDFVIQSDDFVPLPETTFDIGATVSHRLEAQAYELLQPQLPVVPIDAVVAIAFNKPIYEVLNDDGDAIDETTLLIQDADPNNDLFSERYETDYQDLKYTISYAHVIHNLQVRHRPIGGGSLVQSDALPASWDLPEIAEDGQPAEGQPYHQVLYLNAFFPPELQFDAQQLGEYEQWLELEGHTSPCQQGFACVMAVTPRPNVAVDVTRQVRFETAPGNIVVKQSEVRPTTVFSPKNSAILNWSLTTQRLILPYGTYIEVPHVSSADLSMGLFHPGPEFDLQGVVLFMRVQVEVEVRGVQDLQCFDVLFSPSNEPCRWTMSIKNEDFDTAVLEVALPDVTCATPGDAQAHLRLVAPQLLNPITSIRIKGFDAIMDPKLDWQNTSSEMYIVYPDIAAYQLHLSELCVERLQADAGSWGIDTFETGSTLPTSSGNPGVDALIAAQLLEPNREYVIDYSIRTFATVYHEGVDGPSKENSIEIPYTTGAELQQIRFRTADAPTQDVAQYVGFAFPGAGMDRPYPASTIPLLTLKYQGLIRHIYAKHYGSDVLIPRMVDINGQELQPTLVDTVGTYSDGLGGSLEDLLQNCLPEGAEFTFQQVQTWLQGLEPDMAYSLQLADLHIPEDVELPFQASFTTSRFNSFANHVTYVAGLEATADQHPFVRSTTAAQDISAFINGILSNPPQIGPFDTAVEQFYRVMLGVDGGRLSPDSTQDYLSFLVGLDPADPSSMVVWGVVLELVEPLIGKAGISTAVQGGFESWQNRGLTLTSDDQVLLRDQSGSRVIVLHTSDGQTFTPFTDDLDLVLDFAPENAVKEAIASFISTTFLNLNEPQQEARVVEILNDLKALDPDIASSLSDDTQTLHLPLP